MTGRDYQFTVRKDSTIPEGRERSLRRIRAILTHFPDGVPDRVNCFLHGLRVGWLVSHVIGQADADEIRELLPPEPSGGVIDAIPDGHEDVIAPEVDVLTGDQVLDDYWFMPWMGIKNDLYYFRREGKEMPERSVLTWLGYLLGELEGGQLSQADYDILRALLPPVNDDLTPLVKATKRASRETGGDRDR